MTSRQEFYSLLRPGNLFLMHQRERALVAALREEGVDRSQLSGLRIIEVGCGGGGFLPQLLEYGADPQQLFGVDLDPDRIRHAKRRYPAMHLGTADATSLPFPDRSFDLVIQSTLFTSLLDPDARRAAAAEMMRVLRHSGFILWFDFRYDSPSNPLVRGVPRREVVGALFPNCSYRFRTTLLVPPLARRLVPICRPAAEILSLIPLLRTHLLATIRPFRGQVAD